MDYSAAKTDETAHGPHRAEFKWFERLPRQENVQGTDTTPTTVDR